VAEGRHGADEDAMAFVLRDVLEAAQVGLIGIDGKDVGENLAPATEDGPGVAVYRVELISDV